MLYFAGAAKGSQDRCCYSEDTSSYIYSCGNAQSLSVNSTTCANSESYAPCLKCSVDLASFFNNHSHFYKTGNYVSCYFLYTTPSKEDNNCFFSGSSCSGPWPVTHQSTNTNCVLTKFNFVNNTDSAGYFKLGYNNHKKVKQSVIVFKSTGTVKLVHSSNTDSTLSIEGCTVVASGAIQADAKVTFASGTITTEASVPAHTPFRSHPDDKHCWNPSIGPPKSPQVSLPFFTLVVNVLVSIASTLSILLWTQ